MATTPLLTGEFIKVIDNSGKVRIPRTVAEAVQLPDGRSLQDYLNNLDNLLEGDLSVEVVLDILERLEQVEQTKLEVDSSEDDILLGIEDNEVIIEIGDVVKKFVFADDINSYVDSLSSENLITTEKNIVESINELSLRIDETIICDDEIIYEDDATIESRLARLETTVMQFAIIDYEEKASVASAELDAYFEILNQDTTKFTDEQKIERLESLIEFYVRWENN